MNAKISAIIAARYMKLDSMIAVHAIQLKLMSKLTCHAQRPLK